MAARVGGVLHGAFTAFARCGDPRHEGLAEWPVHDLEHRSTLLVGEQVRTVSGVEKVWDSVAGAG